MPGRREEAWRENSIVFVLMSGFALLSAIAVAVLVRRQLLPIEEITRALDKVGSGDYAIRLPELRLPELARISIGFNRMADVLEEQQGLNKQLSARNTEMQDRSARGCPRSCTTSWASR